ncbi:unnamed protein product, partial [Brachionus calyciflorus]
TDKGQINIKPYAYVYTIILVQNTALGNGKSLQIYGDLDSQKVGYTYRNGDYKALIDHIVWHKNESDFKMVEVKIFNGNINSSDHLPITIKIDVDLGVKDESNQNLEKMIPEMEHYFTKEPNLKLINQFYKKLCGTLLRAARTAEKSTKNLFSAENTVENFERKQIEEDTKLFYESIKEKVYDYPVTEFEVKSAITSSQIKQLGMITFLLNCFANVLEHIILQNIDIRSKINTNQFGYKNRYSCKHAYFMVNETINYYNINKTNVYLVSLDAQKAFDKLWRTGLFFKLKETIHEMFWRVLFNYYSVSCIIVKYENQISEIIRITEGVKQGGVLSPHLFNFFIDELIQACTSLKIGCRIGSINTSIVGSCADIVLLSPTKYYLQILLNMCGEFGRLWRINFNPNKSVIIFQNWSKNDDSRDFYLSGIKVQKLKNYDKSQACIVKRNIRLSKFTKNTALLEALKVKSISRIYYKSKILFYHQIKKLNPMDELLSYLNIYYNKFRCPEGSFMKQIRDAGKIIDLDPFTEDGKVCIDELDQFYVSKTKTKMNSIEKLYIYVTCSVKIK